MNEIRVCTFNVRVLCPEQDANNMWDKRLPRILRQLGEINPDLIGFQEATMEQYSDLTEALTDYDSVFLARDGQSAEGTPVLYKKQRFELVNKGSYYLNEHPETPGKGWDAMCLRVASYATLKDRQTGKQFTYFNTHLDHVGENARVNGIKLMVDKMRACGGSMILSGDFNVFEGSETYNLAASMLTDSKTVAKTVKAGPTFHNYGSPDYADYPCIDYIFVSSDIAVSSYTVYNKREEDGFASDHYALYADIVIG